jgi:hypothetical protein
MKYRVTADEGLGGNVGFGGRKSEKSELVYDR